MITPSYSEADLAFIRIHHAEHTAKELAGILSLPVGIVYQIGYRNGWKFKPFRKHISSGPVIPRQRVPRSLLPDPVPVHQTVERPKAIYDNSGYLQTAKRYGL